MCVTLLFNIFSYLHVSRMRLKDLAVRPTSLGLTLPYNHSNRPIDPKKIRNQHLVVVPARYIPT